MRLTEHFTLHEFRCRCGCGAEYDWIDEIRKTAEILESLRERINFKQDYAKYRPLLKGGLLGEFSIVINCGVRCPAHNKAVGGAEHSRHLSTAYKGAADTWVPHLPVELWSEELNGFFRGRILYLNKNFVHVDRRESNEYYAVVGKDTHA